MAAPEAAIVASSPHTHTHTYTYTHRHTYIQSVAIFARSRPPQEEKLALWMGPRTASPSSPAGPTDAAGHAAAKDLQPMTPGPTDAAGHAAARDLQPMTPGLNSPEGDYKASPTDAARVLQPKACMVAALMTPTSPQAGYKSGFDTGYAAGYMARVNDYEWGFAAGYMAGLHDYAARHPRSRSRSGRR